MRKFMLALALSCSLAISTASSTDCGRRTTGQLAHSSTHEGNMNAGKVTSIRGRVLYPNGTKAELIIVEVYRNDLATSASEISSAQVDEIIKSGRIDAIEIGPSGGFCFKGLKPGNYMLRANASQVDVSLSQFAMMNIFVTLAPKGAKGARRELEVQLVMAI